MVLSASQQQQLIAAIEDLRMSAVNKEKTVHGWKLEWVLRAPNKSTRGDLCMIAPEGQKLYSVIAVKRKQGLEPPANVAPAAAGDAKERLRRQCLRRPAKGGEGRTRWRRRAVPSIPDRRPRRQLRLQSRIALLLRRLHRPPGTAASSPGPSGGGGMRKGA